MDEHSVLILVSWNDFESDLTVKFHSLLKVVEYFKYSGLFS